MKGTLWEGGHRIPFVIRWPETIKAGMVSDQLISTNDLLATCAELIGKKLPDNVAEDSVSFLPAIKGEAIPGAAERMLVHHSDDGHFAVRKGKWKLVLDEHGGSRRGRDEQVKQPISDAAGIMLFDMEKDLGETANLSSEHPEVVVSLKKELIGIINKGRSTPGAPQENYKLKEGEKWVQMEELLK
ncbi:sulfatase/phosphatase domain-containing protein [Luteolibacter algae]|uniref:Sulfatase/phosphatase domain-containing protein n=1 Tax=Luteolibacter algae TaxID=454151 RepID=A0ABW5DD56_9BACT